jgi:uncharacterized surface protein with fasciclin (FAS1) repeats
LHWVPGKGEEKGHLEGVSAATLFLPTNEAFQTLPRRLRLFLFGKRVLKKLLQYHIVPDIVVHSSTILFF